MAGDRPVEAQDERAISVLDAAPDLETPRFDADLTVYPDRGDGQLRVVVDFDRDDCETIWEYLRSAEQPHCYPDDVRRRVLEALGLYLPDLEA